MHHLYILYSPSVEKYYVGQSANAIERFRFHQSAGNAIWTRRGQPWKLVAYFEFQTKKDSLIAERFVKRQKSTRTIQKIVKEGFRFEGGILRNQVQDPKN